jgi:hypothetical protein
MRKNSRFSVTFFGFFLTLLKITGITGFFVAFDPSKYQLDYYREYFPLQREAEVKNQSIISTPKRDDRHTKKKHSSL